MPSLRLRAAAGSPSAHIPTAASSDSQQRGLLVGLSQRRGLPSGIAAAVASGTLQLDDAQRDYMHALLGKAVPQQSSATASSSDAAHVPGVHSTPATLHYEDGVEPVCFKVPHCIRTCRAQSCPQVSSHRANFAITNGSIGWGTLGFSEMWNGRGSKPSWTCRPVRWYGHGRAGLLPEPDQGAAAWLWRRLPCGLSEGSLHPMSIKILMFAVFAVPPLCWCEALPSQPSELTSL